MDPQQQQQEMSSNSKMLERARTEKKAKAEEEHGQKCPRCDSTNTKFCYYNNYSLSQPRFFCKSCRRYWTKGGSLRNVPVGGACRKNKRSSKTSQSLLVTTNQNPLLSSYDSYLDEFSSGSYLDALTQNHNTTNFQSLYYGYGGNGSCGEMKQEMFNANYRDDAAKNMINMGGDLDSGRQTWNGIAPSWHNTPLLM